MLIAVIDIVRLLLLLLSRFSPLTLCHPIDGSPPGYAIPWFSRQEQWSGCHFLLQCMKVKSESEVAQSCLTLPDPVGCSPPGSSVHGIFQARELEWVAIAVSIVRLESYKPKFLIKIDKIYSQQNINELNPVVHTQGKMSDCYCWVTSVVSNSVRRQRWQRTRLPIPGILQARTLEWVAA